jgi:hypothetical protein
MRKYCDLTEFDLEILMDLQVFCPPDYEKLVFDMRPVGIQEFMDLRSLPSEYEHFTSKIRRL